VDEARSSLDFNEAGLGGRAGDGRDLSLGGTGGRGGLQSPLFVKIRECLGFTGSFQLKVIGGSSLDLTEWFWLSESSEQGTLFSWCAGVFDGDGKQTNSQSTLSDAGSRRLDDLLLDENACLECLWIFVQNSFIVGPVNLISVNHILRRYLIKSSPTQHFLIHLCVGNLKNKTYILVIEFEFQMNATQLECKWKKKRNLFHWQNDFNQISIKDFSQENLLELETFCRELWVTRSARWVFQKPNQAWNLILKTPDWWLK